MPNIEPVSSKKVLQAWLLAMIVVSILAISPTIQQANELEIVFWRSKRFMIVYLFVFASLFGLWFLNSSFLNRITQKMDELQNRTLHPIFGFILILFGFLFIWIMRLYVFGS